MAPACEMQERDNPPDSPTPSRPDNDPNLTPSTESLASTPDTSADTPVDKHGSCVDSARGERHDHSHDNGHDNDQDGTSTPRHPRARLEPNKTEEQLRKLHDKLANLEQHSRLERLARRQMEKQLADGMFPMASVALTEAMAGQPISRAIADEEAYEGTRRHMGLSDMEVAAEDPSVGRYTAVTISLLENQLARLKNYLGNINELQEDRDRLRDTKTLWEREREVMKKRIQELQPQADQSNADGQPAADTADSTKLPTDESSAVPAVPAVPVEKPILNHITWEDWRLCHLNLKGYSCAIDVLDGEPDVNFERPVYYNYWEPARMVKTGVPAKQRFNIALKSKADIVPGPGPIAERIRINSRHILRILSKIHGESISEDDSPLVMIRPFKGLNYYDKAIREKLLELKAEFGPEDERSPPSTPTTEAPPKEVNTAPTDAAGNKGGSKLEEAKDEWTFSLTAYDHLKCLVQFMDEEIETKISYLEKSLITQISFTDIWYLFKPGVEVVDQTLRQVYRVVNVTSPSHKLFSPWRTQWDKKSKVKEETPVVLVCVSIDFDGKSLGPSIRKVRIPRYDNEKAVTSLEVFPLRFAEQRISAQAEAASSSTGDRQAKISLRDKLIARGKLFVDMTGFKHMHYNGLALDTRDEVDSNVVVDFQEAFSYFQNQKPAQQEQARADGSDSDSSSGARFLSRPSMVVQKRAKAKWHPELRNIVGESLDTDFGAERCTADCCRIANEQYHNDSYGETKRNRDYIQRLMPEGRGEPPPSIYIRPLQEIKLQEEPLSDADFLIMSYRVFAFVLRSRKWAQLDLTHLRPPDARRSSKRLVGKGMSRRQARKQAINNQKRATRAEEGQGDGSDQDTDPEDDTAFGQLVLPPGHKKMVKSLVAQHFRDKESKEGQQVDIVSGKGKGLIILLHGAPGVGKTTTAEGVAEKFEKPLYQITCGDLGTTAPQVEKALETSFSLASRWGCVLLLDEADVFLAARSRVDFQRNGLVSVFLRVLEYYTGVLFLTTNRIGDFDEAFASRIHISLYYPQLDLDSTLEIFELNLDMIESRLQDDNSSSSNFCIDRGDILQFAADYFRHPAHKDAKWNGRQIRNACQTALALAEFRSHERRTREVSHSHAAPRETAVHLKVRDLKTVSDAYLEFINYLNTLRGFDADEWATKLQIRAQDVEFLLRMAEVRDMEKAREKEAHALHKTDSNNNNNNNNNNKQDTLTVPLHPPSQSPSTVTEAAARFDFSAPFHHQHYGAGGGGPVPSTAAATISTAAQPIPPGQAPTGTAPPMGPPLAYAQQGYYYGPHAGYGGYGPPPPPQGAPPYIPPYQQQQQTQHRPYGEGPQPPSSAAPPPNFPTYNQQLPPPGSG